MVDDLQLLPCAGSYIINDPGPGFLGWPSLSKVVSFLVLQNPKCKGCHGISGVCQVVYDSHPPILCL